MKKQEPKIQVIRELSSRDLKLITRTYYAREGKWLVIFPCVLLLVVGWVLVYLFPEGYWYLIPWGIVAIYVLFFLVAITHMAKVKVKSMWNKPQPVNFDEEIKNK